MPGLLNCKASPNILSNCVWIPRFPGRVNVPWIKSFNVVAPPGWGELRIMLFGGAIEGHKLRERLVNWCEAVLDTVTDAWPAMPEGIEDRDADVWEALLAVADAAGDDWPDLARVAAVALVAQSREGTPSLGIHLLSDLKEIFEDRDAMSTATILAALNAKEEAPWGDLKGKPLDSRRLAYFLRKYGVRSKDVRLGETVVKGYTRADLWDQWSRYLAVPPPGSATSATSATGGDVVGAGGAVGEVWES